MESMYLCLDSDYERADCDYDNDAAEYAEGLGARRLDVVLVEYIKY